MASTEGVADGRHEQDVGARRDQGGQPALGDLAAAEHDDAAAGEAESDGVGGVFGHGGWLLGRGAGLCGAAATVKRLC